jgi:hypothetical protein
MSRALPRPSGARASFVSEQLLHRIRSEFDEMPGLQLTARQAQRLWGLDADTCHHVLTSLLDTKFLHRLGPDRYGRPKDGQ